MRIFEKTHFAIAFCALTAGCSDLPLVGAQTIGIGGDTDANEPGGCFASDQTPAVIETKIQDVLVSPAVIGEDGSIFEPAKFRTETVQTIVSERRNVRFQTPCPPVMDQEFLATLQRALKARGHYQGEITGNMDAPTKAAIRSFQSENGLNSAILSTQTARQLGLVV